MEFLLLWFLFWRFFLFLWKYFCDIVFQIFSMREQLEHLCFLIRGRNEKIGAIPYLQECFLVNQIIGSLESHIHTPGTVCHAFCYNFEGKLFAMQERKSVAFHASEASFVDLCIDESTIETAVRAEVYLHVFRLGSVLGSDELEIWHIVILYERRFLSYFPLCMVSSDTYFSGFFGSCFHASIVWFWIPK